MLGYRTKTMLFYIPINKILECFFQFQEFQKIIIRIVSQYFLHKKIIEHHGHPLECAGSDRILPEAVRICISSASIGTSRRVL